MMPVENDNGSFTTAACGGAASLARSGSSNISAALPNDVCTHCPLNGPQPSPAIADRPPAELSSLWGIQTSGGAKLVGCDVGRWCAGMNPRKSPGLDGSI